MEKELKKLITDLKRTVSDCKQFSLKNAKKDNYSEALELYYQGRVTEKIVYRLEKILNEGKNGEDLICPNCYGIPLKKVGKLQPVCHKCNGAGKLS